MISAVLAIAGLWLLHTPATPVPHPTSAPWPAPAATVTVPSPPPSRSTASSPPSASASAPPASASSVTAPAPDSGLAPADGPGGDHLVQALLEAHTPNNLPARLEVRLAALGQAVWLADLTGHNREQWPPYFTTPGSSGYTSVRIQAAAARATTTGHVTVTLIWAGTSPAGDAEVGLPGTVNLTEQRNGTWEPTR